MSTTYENAADLEFFNECLDTLIKDLLYNDLGVTDYRWDHNSESKLQKSAWVASLLASSDDEEHQSKALSFAILAYIEKRGTDDEEMYERYLYIVLSRIGNLQTFNTVRREQADVSFEERLISSLDSALGLELSSDLQQHELGDGTVLSSFQKDILNALQAGKDIAISGPTSSGKSFILRKYIQRELENQDGFEAIYVVPTRALIAEVSEKLSSLNDYLEGEQEIEVRTGAYFEEGSEDPDTDSNSFLVVTPERCLRLIDEDTRARIDPDLIFFDEIQNIQDGQRGVLFEDIIQLLSESWPETQIVAAGPYLEEPQDTLSNLTDREVVQIKTAFTPVLQMKAIMRFKSAKNQSGSRRMVDVVLYSPSGDKLEFTIAEPDDLTYTTVNKSKTRALTTIIDEYGQNSQNLVYASKTNLAEDRADAIANNRDREITSARIDDLTEFLKNTIHENYPLIDHLKKGVAFHHGRVPKIAREEIEDLYRSKVGLDTIVCTSTLLEGVNLPAEKIFLTSAYRGDDELSELDFQNLVGRVGRVDSRLYGSIYCVEAEDDEWVDEKLNSDTEESVNPATSQATDNPNKLITALGSNDLRQLKDASTRYTSILLRSRYLKSDYDVDEYLSNKGLSDSDISSAKDELDRTLEDIEIPEKLLRRNPTVDPVEQNTLYRLVMQNPERWVIGENTTEYSYDKLMRITQQLNQVFKFTKDDEYGIDPPNRETKHGALEPIVVVANQWLRGETYHSMIDSRQANVEDEGLSKCIRTILDLVNDDVRFILVKYYGMLVDILEESDYEMGKWASNFDQMLEMGSMNFGELRLMSKGVDRSVALQLGIPPGVDNVEDFLENRRGKIPEFFTRHLQSQGVL
ncbi:DEAD/DEAH box helicase [Natrinema sp. J7-2]|uniref:DEAD/DEAH box helicase n=1 Tax=Natrinema sp. (strain J7-2) TaxID=406552 RepID=UPI00026D5152|nr:DEAD/DEAH box helicase [Natrinema sp. J7-2]AFO59526.1 DEAD/DEAH box helicase domain-containing protein [Natrinema sp. J7-2]